MNKIYAVPLVKFNEILKYQGYKKNIAYISIQEPVENNIDYFFTAEASNILIEKFEDTEDHTNPKSISDYQAERIINFVSKHKDKDFLIHCTAGISRSGAIATYVHTYLNNVSKEYYREWWEFKNDNRNIIPNSLIFRKLLNLSSIS